MPRKARRVSETGIYHVMVRGVNRQQIFVESADYVYFLDTLRTTKEISDFKLYGYCLMGNHAHLLLREGKESLSLSMQRLFSRFVFIYNRRHNRVGHLFQERYKSEAVEDDAYLLTVLRYIHQNPVEAGIADSVSGYKWSSYHEYTGKPGLVETEFILNMFGTEKQTAIKEFIKFMNKSSENGPTLRLDYKDRQWITDEDLTKLIAEKYGVESKSLHTLKREDLNLILKELKSIDGVTIRQLVRVTGTSKFKVEKA